MRKAESALSPCASEKCRRHLFRPSLRDLKFAHNRICARICLAPEGRPLICQGHSPRSRRRLAAASNVESDTVAATRSLDNRPPEAPVRAVRETQAGCSLPPPRRRSPCGCPRPRSSRFRAAGARSASTGRRRPAIERARPPGSRSTAAGPPGGGSSPARAGRGGRRAPGYRGLSQEPRGPARLQRGVPGRGDRASRRPPCPMDPE